MALPAQPIKDIFLNKLGQLEAAFARNSGCLVDQNLNIIRMGRFRLCFLSLLRPFYAIFGRDPFSHVRIERVVNQFFEHAKANQSFLQENPSLIFRITKILEKAETKTGKNFSVHKTAISALGIEHCCVFPPDREQIWNGLLLPSDPEAKALFTGILEKQTQAAVNTLVRGYKLPQKGFTFTWRFIKDEDKSRCLKIQITTDQQNLTLLDTQMPVPLSIHIQTMGGQVIKIFIHTKNIVAVGGERKVKRSFDALSGNWFVRKRVQKDRCSELKILEHFRDNPQRGIAEVTCIFEKITKEGPLPTKTMVLQPLYDENMGDFLSSEKFKDWGTRFTLMKDITCGLTALHKLATKITFTDGSPPLDLKMFHMDLKPSNILIRLKDGRLTAAITDFGFAGGLKPGGSLGYKAPEEAALEGIESFSEKIFINHFVEYGQSMDVWALGLLFMDLAVKRPQKFVFGQESRVLTQLPCIHECIFTTQEAKELRHERNYNQLLASLQQEQVDASIQTIRTRESLTGFQKNVWDLIQRMLLIDPKRRISSNDALLLLTSLPDKKT